MFKLVHDYKRDRHKRHDTLTWTLLDIMNFLERNKNQYTEFRMDNHIELIPLCTNFKLKIKCSGISNDLLEIFYLFPRSVVVKSKLQINKSYFDEHTLADNEYQDIQSNKWMYLATLYKKDINNYVLDDKSLRFVFTFEIMTNVMVLNNDHIGDLTDDLHTLLNTGLYSDLILKSADGQEFKVHKAILASRTLAYKSHFYHLDCDTNIVESPFESDILIEVLSFMYSDKSPRVGEFPEKLLAAAHYYHIDKLKELCAQTLQENLSVDNAVKTLELAKLYSAKRLKKLTLQFIKDGHTRDIVNTKGWAEVKSNEIIKSIYEYIIVNNEDEEMSYEKNEDV